MFAVDGDYIEPCRRVDPELFFSRKKHEIELAKKLCGTCRIRLICLERTLDTERDLGERMAGVHGGLTPAERENTTFRRIDGGSIHREDATNDQPRRLASA